MDLKDEKSDPQKFNSAEVQKESTDQIEPLTDQELFEIINFYRELLQINQREVKNE